MRLTITLAVVALASSLAHADAIVPPVGWHVDADKAADQAARLRKLPHFGGAPTEYSASVFVPATPGIVLYVTRLTTTANSPAAIRAALDDFQLPTRESGVQVGDSTQHVDDPTKQLIATIGIRDRGAQLVTLSALVAVASAKQLVVLTGDCIARDDIDPKLLDACKSALATLDSDIKPADRIAIALPPAGEQLAPVDPPPATSSAPTSHMDDGSRIVMPPMVVPQESQSDRRPIYIGGGLILLAAAFWWNRKRRERFERVDRGEPEPEPASKRGDDDSDDLHAAAAAAPAEAEPADEVKDKPKDKTDD